MAIGAGCIEYVSVKRYPIGTEVAFRFRSSADFDLYDKICWTGHNWYGVAKVAFQANSLIKCVEMVAVVAAETAGGIPMTKIVNMAIPIGFLFREYRLVVIVLQLGNGLLDECAILIEECRVVGFIVIQEAGDPAQSGSL